MGMGYKKKVLIVLLSSLSCFLAILAIIFLNVKYDFIGAGTFWQDFSEGILQPLLFFSPAIFLCSLLLYFLREAVFTSWFRFAKWYLPIAMGIIIYAGLSDKGGSWGIPSLFDSEIATWLFSSLFFLLSLLIICYKSYQLRKEK